MYDGFERAPAMAEWRALTPHPQTIIHLDRRERVARVGGFGLHKLALLLDMLGPDAVERDLSGVPSVPTASVASGRKVRCAIPLNCPSRKSHAQA